MRDNARHQSDPRNWGEAFAALPLDAPDQSRWPAIAATVTAPRRPARQRQWMALAAALFAVAVVPVLWLRQGDDTPVDVARTSADATTSPALAATDTSVAVAAAPRTDASDQETTPGAAVDASELAAISPRSVANASRPPRDQASEPSPAATPSRVTDSEARTALAQDSGDRIGTVVALKKPDLEKPDLEQLYAESAQLEAVLAIARDERVASGPAAALSGELEAQLAAIDTQLAQPGLSEAQLTGLWRARVDALQQVAGFESTRRWLSAQGERYDGALVSVD